MLFLVLLGLLAAMQPAPLIPGSASWTLTSAQSSLDPPNTLSITPLHEGVHVVMSGETHLDFRGRRDTTSPAPGNLGFDQIELRRIGKKQVELKEKKDGALVATVREKVSSRRKRIDGHDRDDRPSRPDNSMDAGPEARRLPSDLFAGDWTEDLSKTRLRAGIGAQD